MSTALQRSRGGRGLNPSTSPAQRICSRSFGLHLKSSNDGSGRMIR